MANIVKDRLRAELDSARSYYGENDSYYKAIEKFVRQSLGEVELFTEEELKIFHGFLTDYVNRGFRFSPINLNKDSFTKDGDRFVCDRCRDLYYYKKDGVVRLVNLKPYKINVTNEYILGQYGYRKSVTPTTRFNGDHIALFVNKGGIIRETYIVIDYFKEIPSDKIIEPENIKFEIPVTMIHDTIENRIIFAVDHKSKALKDLLNMYEYHYERNPNVYYNIRNKKYR